MADPNGKMLKKRAKKTSKDDIDGDGRRSLIVRARTCRGGDLRRKTVKKIKKLRKAINEEEIVKQEVGEIMQNVQTMQHLGNVGLGTTPLTSSTAPVRPSTSPTVLSLL